MTGDLQDLRLDEQLCFALYSASNTVVRAYRPLLAQLGLTYPQFLVMAVMWEHDSVSMGELATRLDRPAHGLTPVLRRLMSAGLVTRTVDHDDRRVIWLHLTAEGRALDDDAARARADVVCRTDLDPPSYANLRDSLRALTRRIGDTTGPRTPSPAPGLAAPTSPNGDTTTRLTASLLSSTVVAAYLIDGDGLISAASPAATDLLHWPAEDLVGRAAHTTLHHTDLRGVPTPSADCPIHGALRTGRIARADRDTFWRRDGAPVSVWWTALPAGDESSARTLVVFERHPSTRSSTPPAEADDADVDTRLLVLGQLSELLGVSNVEDGLQRIAALAASTLADWCVVDRVDDGVVTRAALADRISDQTDLDVRLRTMPRLTAQSTGSLGRVLRGIDNVAIDLLSDDQPFPGLSTDPLDVAQADLFADLGAAHAFVVPLRARDHVQGALTWVRQDPGQPFTDTDILLATVFGFRVGLWLDNARLYSQQKRISEVLQRSLLTALPQPNRFEVAARYVPASTGSEVGGDWYDAVLRDDRHLTVTIGDVTGHDNDAAARMAQLRSMTRFAMLDHPDRPDLAVARVDAAMRELAFEGQATAIVAVITHAQDEQAAGLHGVTWTNAGHLPPLVVDSRGGTRLLDTSPDLLLGVRPSVPRQHHHAYLDAGETLVLFTDGLLERHDEHIDAGLDRLVQRAADLAHLPLEQFCDDLLTAMVRPAESRDDIAIVTVRVHPDSYPQDA